MRQLLSRFVNRLQWRLTAICVLTAVLSVTLINVLIMAFAFSQILSEKTILEETYESIAKSEPEVAQFFADDGTPDTLKLTRWLDKQSYDMIVPQEQDRWSFNIFWGSANADLVAVRLDGAVLVASPNNSHFREGKALTAQLRPEERAIFEEAQRRDRLIVRKAYGHFCATLPVHRQGKVVALGFVRSPRLPTLTHLWRGVPDVLGSMVLVMGIGSILVGGLIGSFTARKITRRLERASGVAQQWAAGKLSASITEGPTDEIGMLERSLNQMALQLEQVFTLQYQVATLQERERITHDLHDTLKQEVFATAMLLGTAQEQLQHGQLASLRTSLSQLTELSEQLQTDLGAILKALPFSADAEDLAALLPLWLGEWSRRSGMVSSIIGTTLSLPLPSEQLLQVRSILYEALSNIARHSNATRVTLELVEAESSVTLRLQDNGQGFRSAQKPGAMGMATMRERARALPGGSLGVVGTPGSGTEVTLKFNRERL
jgi:two-component system, NarL family, sensor histidine kinase LiaS